MIKIGVVGEDPNDTSSVISLLSKKYPYVQFRKLAKGVTGCQLDSRKLITSLTIEVKRQQLKSIIYIRDLDGFDSERAKLIKISTWFTNLDNQFGRTGILLTNIWELEALIFADISTFNTLYKVNHQFKGDPSKIKDPKQELKKITRNGSKKFHESHCPQVFDQLDVNQIAKNCTYFNQFLIDFSKLIV
ncbi:hypothetical protein [Pedobacter sp. MC2016-24]|uniref:hypothetical protein n=1 Tax=Pedobacter sp. MC2016-24 TaxID=2780090 RepID=UPI001881C32A|nr:hypothetical protein [Pedobacter sp. MC2016-24]MBE9601989.1 hypothetical protein [Pedobacter sp. MC2016-24]